MRMLVLIPLLAMAPSGWAQSRPAFEVASVKPADPAKRRTGDLESWDAGRVTYNHANLKVLIMAAYQVKYYQLDGPSWLETQQYDVSAKLPDGASQGQIPAMLQSLLAERFRLVVHREVRNEPAFALLVGKNGAKLNRSEGEGDFAVTNANQDHFEWRRATMARFAQSLSGPIGRPVVDMTGLDGRFDITLELNAADLAGMRNAIAAAQDNSEAGSIFAALQGLGLKLESRRAPIEHLVVDHVEKIPTEN